MYNKNRGNAFSRIEMKLISGIKPFISDKSSWLRGVFVLGILFGAGVVFHIIPFTKPLVLKITDLFLFGINGYVIYVLLKAKPDKKLIIWSISAFLLTYLAELAGVKTGKVFGDYWYGETMRLQIEGVPLVIAFNWVILILATNSMAGVFNAGRFILPILASLLIVVFDFVMEPVAMKLDYWQWSGDMIPFQNYLAWFMIALLFSYALAFLRIQVQSKLLNAYLIIQFAFFLILRIIL